MRDYLVFQLYGSLVAWGDIAVGETRPSSMTPSKSAVIGMVAAALGLRRPDTAQTAAQRSEWEADHRALADGYGMAIKVDAVGVPLTDYHTAQVPSSGTGRTRQLFATRRDELIRGPKSNLNTILSRREYRQDVFYAITLWTRPQAPHTLLELRQALLEPHFVLYLGRKSCPPALPLHPEIRQGETIEAVLADLSFENVLSQLVEAGGGSRRRRIGQGFQQELQVLLWDSDAETGLSPHQTITRRDASTSRQRWQFATREEHQAYLR